MRSIILAVAVATALGGTAYAQNTPIPPRAQPPAQRDIARANAELLPKYCESKGRLRGETITRMHRRCAHQRIIVLF
jgi:hypothetical protein